MEDTNRRTLRDLVVLTALLGALAVVSIPQYLRQTEEQRRAEAQAELQDIRNALGLFQAQCGDYPRTLADLTATAPPAAGADGAAIDSGKWHGPYLESPNGELPANACTGGNVEGIDWVYDGRYGDIRAAGLDERVASHPD